MGKYSYLVESNQTISQVESSGAIRTPFYREPRAFEITDFTISSPLYPCREDFLKESLIDNIWIDRLSLNDIYLNFDSTRVEYSTFIHQPTMLHAYTRFYVEVDEEDDYLFDVMVTGGIKIWVNNNLALTYKPYIRNTGSTISNVLHFVKGINEVVVYFNDLAERDVLFFYELKNKSNKTLKVFINLDEDVDLIRKANKVLNEFHLDKDYYEEGNVYLNYDGNIDYPFLLNYKVYGKKGTFILSKENKTINIYTVTDNETSTNPYDHLLTENIGSSYVDLSINIGRITLHSKLFISVYPKKYFNELNKNIPKSYEERRKIIFDFAMASKIPSVTTLMAYLEVHKSYNPDLYHTFKPLIDKANKRDDCADFNIPAFVMLLSKYKELLPTQVYEEIKKMILDFRYAWDEVGNDVMCFYSENHQMCFYVSQYLTGNLFKDEVFKASNRKGFEQAKIGKERINKWLDAFLAKGFSEWYSNTYIPVDVMSFFPLYELTQDADIKEKVKVAIELLTMTLAVNNYKGLMITTHGRTYEKEIKADKTLPMSMINYLVFGQGFINYQVNMAAMIALSSYKIHDYVSDYSLTDEQVFKLNALQGYQPANTYVYRTNYYTMSSVLKFKVGNEAYGSSSIDLVCGIGEDPIRIWINHPGEIPVSGEGRPSYWVGNGISPHIEQIDSLGMGIFKISDNHGLDFIHAYVPFDYVNEYVRDDKHLYIKKDNSYLCIYMHNGIELSKNHKTKNREIVSYGRLNFCFMKASSVFESKSFEDFINECQKYHIEVNENSFVITTLHNTYKLVYNEGLFINNNLRNYTKISTLEPEIIRIKEEKIWN